MTPSAALLAAGLAAVSHAQVERMQDCVTQITGIEAPAVAPLVYRSQEWTLPAEGVCCDAYGRSGGPTSRGQAIYKWRTRIIILARSASNQELVHELAVDAKRLSLGLVHATTVQMHATDTWAYSVDKYVGFLEGCER